MTSLCDWAGNGAFLWSKGHAIGLDALLDVCVWSHTSIYRIEDII